MEVKTEEMIARMFETLNEMYRRRDAQAQADLQELVALHDQIAKLNGQLRREKGL